MDFFGSAFDFLDNAAQSVGDFFSNAADSVFGSGTTDYNAPIGPNEDGTMLPASVVGADNAGGLGKTLGAGITGVSKALGAFNTAGSTAKQLSRSFALPGQNKEVMGYDKDSNPAKTPGLKSQDPREAAAFWHSLMQSYTYGK